MRALRELLHTWENWSARDTLTRALSRVSTDDARHALTHSLSETPEVDPLDALWESTELVALLIGWRWQAVHSARVTGATWEQVGLATGVTDEQARADHLAAIERQEQHRIGSTEAYRVML